MRLAIAALAAALLAPCAALAADDGFATRSVTGLGLTGEPARSDTFSPPGQSGTGAAPSPGAPGTGTFGSPGRGAVGAGAGAPAAGGGSFGAPSRR